MTPTAAASSAEQFIASTSTPADCSCPDYRFRSVSDPAHICKHMRQAYPAPQAAAPRPVYCFHCGQGVPAGSDLFCRRCQDDACTFGQPPVPVDLQDAKRILPFPAPAPTLCTNCQEDPALDGDDRCAQCAADQADAEAQYHSEFPVAATRIYAETRRDVLSGRYDAHCGDCGQLLHDVRSSQAICPACRTLRLITGRAQTAATLAAGGNPFA